MLGTLKFDVYDFCSNYYTTYAYVNIYKGIIIPVGNKIEWNLSSDVKSITVLVPNKKSSSCPIETRKKATHEKSQVVKCGICGESSHNRKTCKDSLPFNHKSRKLKAKI